MDTRTWTALLTAANSVLTILVSDQLQLQTLLLEGVLLQELQLYASLVNIPRPFVSMTGTTEVEGLVEL